MCALPRKNLACLCKEVSYVRKIVKLSKNYVKKKRNQPSNSEANGKMVAGTTKCFLIILVLARSLICNCPRLSQSFHNVCTIEYESYLTSGTLVICNGL